MFDAHIVDWVQRWVLYQKRTHLTLWMCMHCVLTEQQIQNSHVTSFSLQNHGCMFSLVELWKTDPEYVVVSQVLRWCKIGGWAAFIRVKGSVDQENPSNENKMLHTPGLWVEYIQICWRAENMFIFLCLVELFSVSKERPFNVALFLTLAQWMLH